LIISAFSDINILYGLAEGEVEGLANGYQSISLEETPLQDANGNLSTAGKPSIYS
jgi:predicted phage tail protein